VFDEHEQSNEGNAAAAAAHRKITYGRWTSTRVHILSPANTLRCSTATDNRHPEKWQHITERSLLVLHGLKTRVVNDKALMRKTWRNKISQHA